MSCFHPLTGYQRYAGAPLSFTEVRGARRVMVPCGQCHGCRLDKAVGMAVRCMHEASLYRHNQFVTLTYRDNPVTLVPRDLTLFLKRLRKVQPFRFYACGEYGEKNGRPHYHSLLFNFPCADRYKWRMSDSGFQVYRSPALESVWSLGNVEVGDVSFQSAAYCARYAMKKQIGKDVGKVQEIVDLSTGEVVTRRHEFARMSLKPGIGADWYKRYWKDVFPRGYVVSNGHKIKPPKYYNEKFKLQSPDEYAKIVETRMLAADAQFDDNSPSRLRVKEIVEKAKSAMKVRN